MAQSNLSLRKYLSPKHYWRAASRWWRDPFRRKASITELVSIALTIVIAFIGFLQWEVYKQQAKIMGSDNPQTQKLIDAANISAQAAKDFSESAKSINLGISNAVDKLSKQAKATVAASNASIESAQIVNKPYVLPILKASGGDLGPCALSQFYRSNPTVYCVSFGYKNFGQTPASRISVSGFVRSAANKDPIPSVFPACLGTAQPTLAKDGSDGCEITAIEQDEIRSLAEKPITFGGAYYVRGYIEFDDIYQRHTKEPFCLYYPRRLNGATERPRICRKDEDWSGHHKNQSER